MKVNVSIKDLLNKEFLRDKEVHALDVLLAGEIAAVEAYNLAIQRVKDVMVIPTLEECRNSHAMRIQFLRDRVERLGAEPPETGGWWGSAARFAEGGASIISDRVAMSVLAAGEDFGYEQYIQHMKDMDSYSYEIAKSQLLPAQSKTLQTMTLLCAWMRAEELHDDDMIDRSESAQAIDEGEPLLPMPVEEPKTDILLVEKTEKQIEPVHYVECDELEPE